MRTYLAIFDTPPVDSSASKDSNLSKAQLKKQRQKENQEKERKAEEEKHGKGGKGAEKKVDPDPEGNALVSADVLAEATKLLITLHKYDPKNVTTNLLAFKVYLRRSIQFLFF